MWSLNSANGKIVFSYLCYDTMDNWNQYPSTLYYEAMDAVNSQGKQILKGPTEFLIINDARIIDVNDWRIKRALMVPIRGRIGSWKT